MRIVIAAPPFTLDNGMYLLPFPSRCDWVGNAEPGSRYYPYELAYLSALLKRDLIGAEVVMLDGNFYKLNPTQYAGLIRSHNPDILITECAHLSYSTMTGILKQLPGVRGIMTGPYATAFPDTVQADGWEVVAGEFEFKILALLRGEPEPAGLIDLDALPFPEDDDIPRVNYWEENCIVQPSVQMYPTRGCPVRCEFCTTPLYYGGYDGKSSHRARSVDNVCAEIEHLAGKYGNMFKGTFFNDETHNANMRWIRALANRLVERGLNGYAYEAMCGYWPMTEPDITLLARAGYRKLRFGVESLTTSAAGGKSGKRVFPDRLERVLQWCNDAGIYVHLTIMVGSLGSTRDSDLETLDGLLEFKAKGLAHSIQHSICTPNPGTAFWQMCKDNGWLATDDPLKMHWHSGAVNYPDYSAKEIEEVFKEYYLLRLAWREL